MTREDSLQVAGDWLRSIEKTREEFFPVPTTSDPTYQAIKEARAHYDKITRGYVKYLLQEYNVSELASVADFPCPWCSCESYKFGEHNKGCQGV